jgi:hypothetical protein
MNSLASSRKAWAAIQSMIGRVMYGSAFNEVMGNDKIKLPKSSSDHPWAFRRSGNTINFKPGLVQGRLDGNNTSFLVTDAGGYKYRPTAEGGGPVYLFLQIDARGSIGFPLRYTNGEMGEFRSEEQRVFTPFESVCFGAKPDPLYSPPQGGNPLRYYFDRPSVPRDDWQQTYIPPNAGDGFTYVPFLYITDTDTTQLLRRNVTVEVVGAHRNLYLWL